MAKKTTKTAKSKKGSKTKKAKKVTVQKVQPASTVLSKELPQDWNAECFNEKTIDPRGFQAADLKPRYFAHLSNLFEEYGQALKLEPIGNPGLRLSLNT